MREPKVSIIIVHYKAGKELFKGLSSIKKSSPKTKYEVIVVDNDERKTIRKKLLNKFPKVKYIRADGNVGYGAGVNLGAKEAEGEHLLVLNPDTEVLPGAIDNLVKFLDKNKNVAVIAPNLVNKNGEVYPQLGSRTLTPLRGIFALSFLNNLFPNNPISRKYYLYDEPRDKKREVDAVPGSALMVRKKVFDEIGGFDENFFLFFEESDFCKRVRNSGYKIFIIPEAEVIHLKGKSTPKSEKIKRIFAQSRFYYFKKHYGYFSAFFVEMFARFSKWHAALIAILVLGTFLRFFRIEENLIFHGELGYDYMTIKNFVLDGKVPLLGPPTSHPWFSLGPMFYWLFSIFLPIGNYHPIVGAYLMAFVGIAAIIISFYVVRQYFGVKAGLISSYLIAISPAWIRWTRRARFNLTAAVLFLPLFYFLTKNLLEKGKYLFWTGFFLGLSSHFFGGYIVLIGAVGLPLFLKRKDFKRKQIKKGLVGFFIPFIPFLLHNILNRFEMLIKIILWVPYRILGFFGLYPKNTADADVIRANFVSFYNFFIESWFSDNSIYAFVLFLAVLVFIFIKTKKSLKWNKKNIPWLVLIILLVVSYLGIFVHGDPPPHYYLIIYPIPIIFLSILLSKILVNRIGKIVVFTTIVLITLVNFKYFFSEKWFYIPKDEFVLEKILVPYKIQEEVASLIEKNAAGSQFELARVGPFDHFEADYGLNYHYLLWRLGNEPVDEANLKYTIYEDTSTLIIESEKELFWIGNIAILKEENGI